MKGFIAKTLSAACLTGAAWMAGAPCLGGGYRDVVDTCYPQRYEYMARQEVKHAFCAQVGNGHVLDQTVWNYHFQPGSAILTPGGLDHLAYLARRRPCPDSTVYLQVAQDIGYDPAHPDKLVEARLALDIRRIQAIQDYLTAQTAGRHVTFTVCRHDPSEAGMSAVPMGVSIHLIQTTSQGVFTRPAGAAGVGGR